MLPDTVGFQPTNSSKSNTRRISAKLLINILFNMYHMYSLTNDNNSKNPDNVKLLSHDKPYIWQPLLGTLLAPYGMECYPPYKYAKQMQPKYKNILRSNLCFSLHKYKQNPSSLLSVCTHTMHFSRVDLYNLDLRSLFTHTVIHF